MPKAKKNARCPLQMECEKKCTYEGHELDCLYYKTNGIGDSTIPDQEEIRRQQEKLLFQNGILGGGYIDPEGADADMMQDDELEDQESEESCPPLFIDARETKGDSAVSAELRMVALGNIVASESNVFNVEKDITALKEDIQINGLLSPLTVCNAGDGSFRLISGHRRFKALGELYEGAVEVPCLLVEPRSTDAEKYMLLQANLTSRELTWLEKDRARKQAEELLITMKRHGREFPGKMRKHVAELLKVSEAELAKIKYASDHLIPELKEGLNERFTVSDRYQIAHWDEAIQKDFYEVKIKEIPNVFYYISYYDDEIKRGKNPFIQAPITSADSENEWDGICKCSDTDEICENKEYFEQHEDEHFMCKGIEISCEGCCNDCDGRYICDHTCVIVKEKNKSERLKSFRSQFEGNACDVLCGLLLAEGLDFEKLKAIIDAERNEGDSFSLEFTSGIFAIESLFLRTHFSASIFSLFWLLNQIKMTPATFFSLFPMPSCPEDSADTKRKEE